MATVLVLKSVSINGTICNPGEKAEVAGPALDNLIRKGRIELAREVREEIKLENESPAILKKSKKAV